MAPFSRRYRFFLVTATALLLTSCGGDDDAPAAGPGIGAAERSFRGAAAKNGIPHRLLMATAWLESRLNPTRSTSVYVNPAAPRSEGDSGEVSGERKGVHLAETAFGLPADVLGLTLGLTEEGVPSDLAGQIEAYAAWLGKKIAEMGALKPDPRLPEDVFDWVWAIASLHRGGGYLGDDAFAARYGRNVRAVFAKELMTVLNEGFVWQDSETSEVLRFIKQSPPLNIEDLSPDVQALFEFELASQLPEIDSAAFFRTGRVVGGGSQNTPSFVEVVHCPLSLSACLELQSQRSDDDIRLEAHYIIPRDNTLVPEPLQVTKHRNIVRLTDSKGITADVSGGIVIMLAGNSGRMVDGYRFPANPTWATKWQLRRLGDLVNDICLNLESNHGVAFQDCTDPRGGVRFASQGASEAYRWGDIADYDPLIYRSYVENPGGLHGETAFDFGKGSREYRAGDSIPIRLRFRPDVFSVKIERLVRCPDQKLVWATVSDEDIRSQTTLEIRKRFFDAGPNLNGEQFFRAMVHDRTGKLTGWDTAQVMLRGFEEGTAGITPKSCLLLGN